MKNKGTITVLVVLMVVMSFIASSTGIFSNEEKGLKEFTSIHGQEIELYGKGIYHNMSSDVAVQGIGQDYITLFLGIPLLIVGLYFTRKDSLRGRFFLAGVSGYFLVTYLFYTVMAMYNELYIVYVSLIGLSFFTLSNILFTIPFNDLKEKFSGKTPNKLSGIFLMVNALLIALLWLQVVVPPLLDGTIIPETVQHYTTLIVQGMDLGLLLPLSVVSGLFFLKKRKIGYLMAPVYLVFLSLLMTALLAKIVAMSLTGVSAGPALVIIPILMLLSYTCTYLTLKSVKAYSF